MGKRDYRHREPKKGKKDAKKAVATTLPTPVAVEVVRKPKKPRESEEEA